MTAYPQVNCQLILSYTILVKKMYFSLFDLIKNECYNRIQLSSIYRIKAIINELKKRKKTWIIKKS